MTKQKFLFELKRRLSGLPTQDIEERVCFYDEMIDDRMEDGLTEKEAVLAIGSVDAIVEQIVSDVPLKWLIREKIKPKRQRKVREFVLLILGSPIWLSLGIATFSVMLSLYVLLWSLIVSVWAVFISFAAGAIGGVTAGIFFALSGNDLTGIAMVGAGIVFVGLAIFLFFGCKAAMNGIIHLSKKITLGIKKCFLKKENA